MAATRLPDPCYLGETTSLSVACTLVPRQEMLKQPLFTFQNEPTLLATTVKKGGQTVEIRKPDGAPLFQAPGPMHHAM